MNQGIASIYFASQPNITKVYGFEPLIPNYEKAPKNIELNANIAHKIESFGFGLGKSEGELQVEYNEKYPGRVSTSHAGVNKTRNNLQTIKPASEVLASLFEAHSSIILKVDAEGAEFDIMEDLNKHSLLDKIKIIIMEYHYEDPFIIT